MNIVKKTENRKEYSTLEKEYSIERLSIRRTRSLLRYMFHQSKDEKNKVKSKSDQILRSNKKMKLRYKFSKLTKLHQSPFYRGVKIWNELPWEVQRSNNSVEFMTDKEFDCIEFCVRKHAKICG